MTSEVHFDPWAPMADDLSWTPAALAEMEREWGPVAALLAELLP